MNQFPRTVAGGVSVPRMIVGTNYFLGFTHCTKAKDEHVREHVKNPKKIADILEVFFRAGVNAVMSSPGIEVMDAAIKEAEDRTGVKAIIFSTPMFRPTPESAVKGIDPSVIEKVLDGDVARGAAFTLPHVETTDRMLDKCTRKIRHFDVLCAKIRERGLIPGLSTHTPEAIVYADESGLDVETYISIYNAMGFLMHMEVDWTQRLIEKARKPVLVIKPMASGHLRPLQGMTFVWNTIRACDMVAVGTVSPAEAAEVIELSLSILERRTNTLELQTTRSKATL